MSEGGADLDYESSEDTRKRRRPLTGREIVYWGILLYLVAGIVLVLLGV